MIVVDDGSDYDPRPLARALAGAFPLRIARRPHRGVSRARNTALALARAPWLALHDDDLRPRPDFVRHCLDFHRRHPDEVDAALLYFQPDRVVATNLLVDWVFRAHRAYPFPARPGVYSWHYLWSGALTCKKSIFRHGRFSPRYHALEDTELGLRLSRHLALRVHFSRRVLSTYVRDLTFPQFYRRTYAIAYYTGVFARDYPRVFRLREASYAHPKAHMVRSPAAFRTLVATALGLEAALDGRAPDRAGHTLLQRLWHTALDHAFATGFLHGRRALPARPGL